MIEKAELKDIPEILHVIQDSILSCIEDHHNDTEAINMWLANKTAENLKLWIEKNLAFIHKDREVDGFILVTYSGTILLNYVSPKKQNKGIGSKLLSYVKLILSEIGINKILLESTLTAQEFYKKNHFQLVESIYDKEKLVGFLMCLELPEIVKES